MRLLVTTPLSVVVDAKDVHYVRADDETGGFGILPGHTEFVTVLAVSVITWRNHIDEEHHVAVRGGVLTVRDGNLVEVATREAVGENTLRRLGHAVLEQFREQAKVAEGAHVSATRLHLAVIRQVQRYLESGRLPMAQGSQQALDTSTTGAALGKDKIA